MQQLNLPKYQFTITENEGKKKIFDPIRKKKIVLTPEEWVRQNFIMFLTLEKKYPASLIAVETKVNINGLSQRADIVVFGKKGTPVLIVECKAPTVKITQDTFYQVLRYNMRIQTKIICVTNGIQHYCALIDESGTSYKFLEQIPEYNLMP